MRKLVFWPHLIAGITVGAIVLFMSITGVLLTYEKQMLAWADRTAATAAPGQDARRLPVESLLEAVRRTNPTAALGGISIGANPDAPALVSVGPKLIVVNAYTGAVLGESSPRLRAFFRSVTEWHRWFAATGEARTTARIFTGWSNLVFFFIVLTGVYLWWPRRWSQLRSVLWFRRGLRGKPRDFNWHNVIGVWSAVPLLVVVASALPMSFPWANAALFRLAGDQPPQVGGPGGPGGERRGGDARVASLEPGVLDGLWARADAASPGWRTMSVRLPVSPAAPVSFTIEQGYGGQPQHRTTLAFDRRTGDAIRTETFASQTAGRRLRTVARFAHTGEILGLAGQTIAGLASAGAVVLVWTGVALALRRLIAWRTRRSTKQSVAVERTTAA